MGDLADSSGVGGIAELRRLLREAKDTIAFLRSSVDLVSKGTIGEGRNFLTRGLQAIGRSIFKTVDGDIILSIDDQGVVTLSRVDGTPAVRFTFPFPNSTTQAIEIRDVRGNIIFAENGIGTGLGSPALELPFQPVAAASGTPVLCGPYGFERTTTSTVFETLFVYDGKMHNLFLDFKFAAMCSNGTTAGEIQVVDLNTGIPLTGFLLPAYLGAIPAGTVAMTVIDPASNQIIAPSNYIPGSPMRLGVQARRSAGAGSVTLAVAQAIGG